jgi:hypothetical protein
MCVWTNTNYHLLQSYFALSPKLTIIISMNTQKEKLLSTDGIVNEMYVLVYVCRHVQDGVDTYHLWLKVRESLGT